MNNLVQVQIDNITTTTVQIQPKAILREIQPVTIEYISINKHSESRDELLELIKIDKENLTKQDCREIVIEILRCIFPLWPWYWPHKHCTSSTRTCWRHTIQTTATMNPTSLKNIFNKSVTIVKQFCIMSKEKQWITHACTCMLTTDNSINELNMTWHEK